MSNVKQKVNYGDYEYLVVIKDPKSLQADNDTPVVLWKKPNNNIWTDRDGNLPWMNLNQLQENYQVILPARVIISGQCDSPEKHRAHQSISGSVIQPDNVVKLFDCRGKYADCDNCDDGCIDCSLRVYDHDCRKSFCPMCHKNFLGETLKYNGEIEPNRNTHIPNMHMISREDLLKIKAILLQANNSATKQVWPQDVAELLGLDLDSTDDEINLMHTPRA